MTTVAAITREECRTRLATIAGAERVASAGETVIVAASDAEQIAEILRFANSNGIAVTPCGSGTKQSWGNAVEAGIRLDLSRMNKLREHAWQDMTCTVEAGCTWTAMQAELAHHGQMVALDPLWPELATVGGIVAANDGGCLRLKYGSLRDLIIGMTVVLADGTIAKTGGKVVKNVAGYDLHKLMTGSFGTLGVITEVNFRLHPLEANTQTWTAVAPEPMQFERALRGLLDSQLTPSSIQLRLSHAQCEIDIKISAPAECMDEHSAKLSKIFGAMELKASDETVWQARQELHDTANAVVLRGSTPVFVDIRPDTLNIDETKIAAAITPKTKAIIVVHYAGVACEMDTIMALAATHKLIVIEDAAQAILACYKGRPLGSLGHMAALSFHETKNIISGEGGALLINDERFIEPAEIAREKGTNRSKFFRGDVDKYTWVNIGSSYLPGEIIAAFLWAQMEEADVITAKRKALWEQYHHALGVLEQQGALRRPIIPESCTNNAHMYYLLLPNLKERTEFIQYMRCSCCGFFRFSRRRQSSARYISTSPIWSRWSFRCW